jgi:hypothetical protein
MERFKFVKHIDESIPEEYVDEIKNILMELSSIYGISVSKIDFRYGQVRIHNELGSSDDLSADRIVHAGEIRMKDLIGR